MRRPWLTWQPEQAKLLPRLLVRPVNCASSEPPGICQRSPRMTNASPHPPSASDTFHGKIGTTYEESTPWWPDPQALPEGTPNVVVIVLDDVGFSDLGCFGS